MNSKKSKIIKLNDIWKIKLDIFADDNYRPDGTVILMADTDYKQDSIGKYKQSQDRIELLNKKGYSVILDSPF